MNLEEYHNHLRGRGVPDADAENRTALIRDFEASLASPPGNDPSAAGKPEAEAFARRLIAQGRNTDENFTALAEYAGWANLRRLQVAWIELADCHRAMDALASEIERRHGREIRKKIFIEPLPPLGADERERSAHTRKITERMAGILSAEQSRAAWFTVQHGIPPEAWRSGDEANADLFRRTGDLDRFFAAKRAEKEAMLTRLRDAGELWYTVRITDEVLEYVTSDPEMEGGRREGNDIYIAKIPYNAERYLRESDPLLKRYYACHCPLVRQAILDGKPVSPDVCHCSLGHASHYLPQAGLEFEGEVLESAVRGDLRCRFVFHWKKSRIPGGIP